MGDSTPSSDGIEPVDVQALAVQMLEGNNQPPQTEETTEETEDLGSDEQGNETKKLGGHPAWQEVLSAVPEELHEALTPKLKEWDAGVTRRFQEIHSQYEPLKAFEPLVEQGYDPDSLSQAVGLYNALNTDPEQLWRALGEAYGLAVEQESAEDDESEYGELPPQIAEQLARQERALELMAEQLQNRETLEQQAQEQAALDGYLEQLRDAYGDYDEDYVLTKMAAGVDGELAVRQYQEIVPPVTQTTKSSPPKVLGNSGVGSGGVPTSSPEVTRLTDQDTKNLVVEMLRATASQQD